MSAVADDTLARMFWQRVERHGDPAGAARQARRGEVGQRDVAPGARWGQEVREVALGLVALGRGPGEAIGASVAEPGGVGAGRLRHLLDRGGGTIPIYPDYPAEEIGLHRAATPGSGR